MKREESPRSVKRIGWREWFDEKIYSSVIAKRFRRIINWLYSLLINGFFGKLFTSYSAEESAFFSCGLYRGFCKRKGLRKVATGFKVGVTRIFENSRVLGAISHLTASLIYQRLKTYGTFLLSLGGYGIIFYFIKVYALAFGSPEASVPITNLVFILLGIPMMLSQKTFSESVNESRVVRALLFDWLGIPRDAFAAQRKFPTRYALVTALGLFLGALTYFIHPLYYVQAAVVIAALMLIFCYPEIGILGLIALVPLSSLLDHPSVALFLAVAVTLLSYIIKVIRGKRVIKLNLMDITVLAFGLVMLLGGLGSAGGMASFASALMYFALLLGYFLTVNLIRTREWVRRGIATLLVSATICAVIGIIQIFTGSVEASWIDAEMFSDIGVRVTGTFGNPNTCASYLLLALPFAPAAMIRKEGRTEGRILFVCFLLLIGALLETWCRGAWLGAMVAAVIFMLVYSRRSVPYLLALGALLPVVSTVLPSNIVSRFVSIGSASDSSSMYRISAWRGVWEMLKENWLGGIGVGEAAFSAVYPSYSYAGIEGIHHTHNLYLQIAGETGVVGLLLFILVVVLFVQNCLEFVYKMRNRGNSAAVIAGLVAIIASLIMGLTDHIWYSYRVFLMFWLVMGLVNARIRIGLAELERTDHLETNSLYSVNFDLNVDNL